MYTGLKDKNGTPIEIPVESISEFSFSDLAMMIYTKVTLEG